MDTPFSVAVHVTREFVRVEGFHLRDRTRAEAAAAVACDIVILSCEPDHNLEAIRLAAPHAFLSVGMPHGAVASPEEAVRLGFAMMKRGADAVYSSHSPRFIEAMAAEGIPVTGHVGLVPNRATWTNFRAIGRTAEEAFGVLRAAKDLENAGAACIEVESRRSSGAAVSGSVPNTYGTSAPCCGGAPSVPARRNR